MQTLSHQIRCFDGFTLDLTRGCLLRGAEEVKLPPKPFEALKYLVENPGRLISKTELIEVIWPDTAVTPDSLVQCLIEVRRALSDDAQQIIKTVPRRGYIFDKAVTTGPAALTTYTEEKGVQLIIEEEEETNESSLPAVSGDVVQIEAHNIANLQRWQTAIAQHKGTTATAILLVIAAVAGIVYFTRPGEAIDSVAVLPFLNDSGDPNLQYLSEGISDNLTELLSQLPNLKTVIASNVVARYKGKQIDPLTVGRDLKVRAVLVGHYGQHGDEVAISLELIDVRDGRHLWSRQYDRKLADIIPTQTAIAQDVSERLRLRLTGEDKKRLTRHYTENAEAYRLYFMGRQLQGGRKEALEKSIASLEQAAKLDPNFALAFTELGKTYSNLGYRGLMDPKESLRKEEELSLRALQLDDALAEAHVLAADVKEHKLDWSGAEEEYRRAIELDPNSVRVLQAYAMHLNGLGRFDEAMQHLQRAQEIDPGAFDVNDAIALVFYLKRQYDKAIEQYRKTSNIDPHFSHGELAQALQARGMYQEAVTELEKASGKGNAQLGYAYALAGRAAEAQRVLGELRELQRDGYVSPFKFALVYIGLGDKDQAFAWLNKTYDEDPYRLTVLKCNPRFESLHSDPRYAALMLRMNLAP